MSDLDFLVIVGPTYSANTTSCRYQHNGDLKPQDELLTVLTLAWNSAVTRSRPGGSEDDIEGESETKRVPHSQSYMYRHP